ncbi:hypothetical protein AB0C77_12880 [Streptomyces sp. NPDC048629]|uniref:hypothetical protein n=1 Tax=Streptomyces sp. NPDC048629 TaxID=3154824 RepID=UPI0034207EEB
MKTDPTLFALIAAVAVLSATFVGLVALLRPRLVPPLTLAAAVGFGIATLLLTTT